MHGPTPPERNLIVPHQLVRRADAEMVARKTDCLFAELMAERFVNLSVALALLGKLLAREGAARMEIEMPRTRNRQEGREREADSRVVPRLSHYGWQDRLAQQLSTVA
jgi:hypothetical protein